MKWLKNAEGPIQDYVHVLVDDAPYCIHRTKTEIHSEGKDQMDFHLLLNNDKHRENLATRASIVHREAPGNWYAERPDSWTVHYGNKTMKIAWDGSVGSDKFTKRVESGKTSPAAQEWISKKIKKLRDEGKNPDQAAGEAYNMAREKGYDVPKKEKSDLESIAEDDQQMAMRMFNKPFEQLTPEERIVLEQAKQVNPAVQPVPPAFSPQLNTPEAPSMYPGAALEDSWTVSAEENPFADKKDDDKGDDKSEDKKDDKKEPTDKKPAEDKKPPKPKEPSKDKKPSGDKGEEKDVMKADKLIKALEDLIKKEESEGENVSELKMALEALTKFLEEEKGEAEHGHDEGAHGPHDGRPMPGGPAKPPMGPGVPVKIDLEPMPGPGHPPLGPMSSGWTEENKTGFGSGDSVWRKADMDGGNSIGLEPGRVVATGNGKVVVDWGDDDVLAEENPGDLVLAASASGESELFRSHSSTNVESVEETFAESEEKTKAEINDVLAKTSLRDLLNRESSTGSSENAIEHLGSGRVGEFIAKASDGRFLVKIGDDEVFLWPTEMRFLNQKGEN